MSKILDTIKSFSPSGMVKNITKESVGKLFESGVEIFNKVHDGKMDIKQAETAFKNRQLEIEQESEQRAVELEKAYLADVSDARSVNSAIQRSKNASWLSKNLPYILDVAIIGAVIVMIYIVVFHQVIETNKEIFYSSFGALLALAGQIMNFHRGTSKDSEESNQAMRDEIKNLKH